MRGALALARRPRGDRGRRDPPLMAAVQRAPRQAARRSGAQDATTERRKRYFPSRTSTVNRRALRARRSSRPAGVIATRSCSGPGVDPPAEPRHGHGPPTPATPMRAVTRMSTSASVSSVSATGSPPRRSADRDIRAGSSKPSAGPIAAGGGPPGTGSAGRLLPRRLRRRRGAAGRRRRHRAQRRAVRCCRNGPVTS